MNQATRYYSLLRELAFLETEDLQVDERIKGRIIKELRELRIVSRITDVCDRCWVVYVDGSTRIACDREIKAMRLQESTRAEVVQEIGSPDWDLSLNDIIFPLHEN